VVSLYFLLWQTSSEFLVHFRIDCLASG